MNHCRPVIIYSEQIAGSNQGKYPFWSKRRISRNLRTSQEQQLDEGVRGVITRTFSRTSFSLRQCTREHNTIKHSTNTTKRCLLSPLQNPSSSRKIIPQPTPRSVLPDYHQLSSARIQSASENNTSSKKTPKTCLHDAEALVKLLTKQRWP